MKTQNCVVWKNQSIKSNGGKLTLLTEILKMQYMFNRDQRDRHLMYIRVFNVINVIKEIRLIKLIILILYQLMSIAMICKAMVRLYNIAMCLAD